MISVVIPVYDECENLAPLLEAIEAALSGLDHEIVMVDDGSGDGSALELARLRSAYRHMRLVELERHAGQSAALVAGFEAARGEIVVTMDADGQNDPAEIPGLLELLEVHPGYTAVVGYRVGRLDTRWKLFQSRVANGFRNLVTGDSIRDTGCSLKAMRRAVLLQLPRFDGMHRFLPTLIRMQGGVVVEAQVSHRPRWHGRSKYGMWNRVFRGVRDVFRVRWLGSRRLVTKTKNDSL
ncbi:MAG: glycosyltransferase family 2 protein [Gemmatimonadota bacterium]|nr:MAG: glycosyltransferase family 2 protein [Gemmatimonadota bacterium]